MRETKIEKFMTQRVKNLGGIAFKFVPLGCRGVPDRIVLMPGGRIFFVELKAPGKTPSKIQMWRHKKIAALGFTVLVIDSMEDVIKCFQ